MGFAWLTGISDPAECCGECAARKPDGCAGFEVRGRSNTRGSTFACVLRNSSQIARTLAGNCTTFGTLGPAPPPAPPAPRPPGPPPPPPPPQTPGPRINDMFHGGAVLQRGQTTSVWGLSTAKSVTLTLAAAKTPGGGQAVTVSGAVNSSGVWLVWLPPQPAAYNRTLTARDSAGSAEVVVSFGEAVLCVGQSKCVFTPPLLPAQ